MGDHCQKRYLMLSNGTYFAQTGRKYDNFIYLAHLLEEVIDAGSLDDIHIMPMIFDFYRHDVVGLGNGLCKAKVK